MQLTFGSGEFFATQLADENGTPTPQATPVRIAAMQECGLEFSGEVKEFHGQNRFAIAVGGGKVKTSGKIKGALINGNALNTLFFNTAMTGGTMKSIYADTVGFLIPASTPFTVTIAPPSTGTFAEDVGVIGSDGIPLTKVASTPAAGQYSVTAGGVYTFETADANKRVYISYSYTYASTSARKIDITNKAMGLTPSIKAHFHTQFQGKRALVELESIIVPKLSLFGTKNDDFSVPELDFNAQTDAAGFRLGTIWVME